MANSPFSRVAARLRNASTIAYQAAQSEMTDTKVTLHHPEGIRAITKQLREASEILDNYASEQETSQGHRKENTEAYMVLAQSLANAATIIGTEGANIKIILFADPDFILELLTEGKLEALEQACRRVEPERGNLLSKWLKGFVDPTKTQDLG